MDVPYPDSSNVSFSLAKLPSDLRLPPSASQAELRRAYYKRAKLLHPDIAGEAGGSNLSPHELENIVSVRAIACNSNTMATSYLLYVFIYIYIYV